LSWQGSCKDKVEKSDYDVANYLLIELVNVVVGLPLGLNVDGMVLNTFGCGHDQLSKKDESGQNLQRTREPKRETYRIIVSWRGWGGGGGGG